MPENKIKTKPKPEQPDDGSEIGLIEKLFVLIASGFMDVLEIIGGIAALSVVGALITVPIDILGWLVSGGLFIWSFFRTGWQGIVVNLVFMLVDAITAGILPARFIGVALSIKIKNAIKKKLAEKITKK